MTTTAKNKEKIRFSKAFWVANTVELFERAAYYGVFIVITLYLSRILGFNDIQAATIAGTFSAFLYLLPTFAGALADKIGFRNSMLLAFTLLTTGYGGLALFPTWLESAGLVEYGHTTVFKGLTESGLQYGIIPIMALIVIGGAFIKSVISGTVAKETTEATRAKGFAIFYGMVNIGAFSGKTIVKPLREALGNEGLITLNYFSASMTFLALIAIWFFYKSAQHSGEGKTFRQIWNALLKVCSNGRLIILILIITGFWMVQHQLYATMPKYVLRLAGEGASPSWYANVNPLVVVLCVNLVTQLMRHRTALTSMTVGMFIMPLSALCMASGVSCERPPAKRRKAVGLIKRNRATVLRISSSLKGFSPSNGVPGIGLNKLMGIDCTFSSASVKANSIRCSIVSPIPIIPPQQISIPTRRAASRVASFCSCVCVEQSLGKKEGAVSRLQW